MGHELRLFLAALRFLTRLPAPRGAPGRGERLGDAVRHFPAVGLLVGAAGATVLWMAAHLWPATVSVGLSMVATAWLTGAMHERGLAATADTLAGTGPQRPGSGAAAGGAAHPFGAPGAIALLAVLGLKAAALVAFGLRDFEGLIVALPLAHAWSRAVPVLLLAALPDAGGTGPAPAGGATVAMALFWCAIAGTLAAMLHTDPLHLVVAACVLVGLAVVAARGLHRRPGGADTAALGAAQQLAELGVYLELLGAASRA